MTDLRATTPVGRALVRGPGFWGFFLAHHYSQQLDRCYLAWFRGRPVWFCARCVGLYPTLILVLLILIGVDVEEGPWDIFWVYLTPLPALVDWSRSRILGRLGSNRLRTMTGVLLGLGLARTIFLNMKNPAHWLLISQVGAMVFFSVFVELLARNRRLWHRIQLR